MNLRSLSRLLAPLERRIKLLATRAVVRLVDPDQFMQELQVEGLSNELLDGVEHWEAYGLTSRPHPGAEALLLSLGGRRSHAVAVSVADRRYRIKNLSTGEVALYTDEDQDGGHRIHFKRGKEIHVVAGASSIVMTPAGITITTPNLDIIKGV